MPYGGVSSNPHGRYTRQPPGGAMKRIAVRLPDVTHDRLRALAAHSGRTATFYIREAIERHLEDLEDLHDAEKAAAEHRETGGRTLSLDELDNYLGLEG